MRAQEREVRDATVVPFSLTLVHKRDGGGHADDLAMPLLISAFGVIVQFALIAVDPASLIAWI
ncbi:MAG TPA: hypothetical protein VET85_05365 [Stellaceae bacterium]|nr:hypothetical protein [Stellaceae bacterium]